MKKKFISVALFGAVIIASSSVLSSCKDYDDDISSVQGELHTGLDALNAQYNALNEALEAAKSEAKAAQEAATAAINEAQSTADEGVKLKLRQKQSLLNRLPLKLRLMLSLKLKNWLKKLRK